MLPRIVPSVRGPQRVLWLGNQPPDTFLFVTYDRVGSLPKSLFGLLPVQWLEASTVQTGSLSDDLAKRLQSPRNDVR
jgi:hypothetical protein